MSDDAIKPARLLSLAMKPRPGGLMVAEMFFEVPLSPGHLTNTTTIKLFARAVTRYTLPLDDDFDHLPLSRLDFWNVFSRPWMLYLEGGPGFGNKEPRDVALTGPLLDRGYQLLYLDYRGTGLSSPINSHSLGRQGSPQQQAKYLEHFRAEFIVGDCEAVRLCLTANQPPQRQKWSIFGQSFGGFVSVAYLSGHPKGLRESFITGGLPPIEGRTVEDVYRATYRRVIERNQAYFNTFAEDAETVHKLRQFLDREGGSVPLPGGGNLTFQRLMTLGSAFGLHGGFDMVHGVLVRMMADLDQIGTLSRATLRALEDFVPFDSCPVYAILHEAIYMCEGGGDVSGWAALRVGQEIPEFRWLLPPDRANLVDSQGQLYFSGEMIYPFMFDDYPELAQMKEAANLVASHNRWDPLYDALQLAHSNEVPVYAITYMDDMYVDFDLARETEKKIRNIKVFHTNGLLHNAVRSKPEEVVGHLFRLRDDIVG